MDGQGKLWIKEEQLVADFQRRRTNFKSTCHGVTSRRWQLIQLAAALLTRCWQCGFFFISAYAIMHFSLCAYVYLHMKN